MLGYEDLEFLHVSVTDGVAVVTLDGPGENNDLSPKGHDEMGSIWPRLTLDRDVRSVVLVGAGSCFSAGTTPEMAAHLNPLDLPYWVRTMEEARRLVVNAIEFEKPVVTALNGAAAGGTLSFALLTDVVIAERQVVFSGFHVPAGIAAGDGGVLFWPLATSLLRAKRYLLTGDPVTADEAAELGLVTEVVEAGQSLDRAMDYAKRFADGDARAIAYTKRGLNQYLRAALPAYDASWTGEIVTGLLKDNWGAFEEEHAAPASSEV